MFQITDTRTLTSDERDLLRFLEMHGTITTPTGSKHGWLNPRSQPIGPLRTLIDKRIVAPLVASSYPLRVEYQLRKGYKQARQEAAAAREKERVKIRDYATDNWLREAAKRLMKE